MNIRPLYDRIVIKPLEKESATKGDIILPDTAKEKPQKGQIVSVGAGKLLDNGKQAVLSLKKGDYVIFGKYAGTEIKIDDTSYIVMKEDEVLARVEN